MTGTLLDSVESAFQSLILGVLGDGTGQPIVFTGKDASNKKAPCVICAADGQDVEEDPKTSGNFWVNCEISFKYSAATNPTDTQDPRTSDITMFKSVFDILRVNNLDALLNAQGQDLTVFPTGFIFSSMKSGRDELGVWVDTLPVRLYCCPSVIPA